MVDGFALIDYYLRLVTVTGLALKLLCLVISL